MNNTRLGIPDRRYVTNESKGRRDRTVPITMPEQRAVLDEAHRLAGLGSLISANRTYIQQQHVYDGQCKAAGLKDILPHIGSKPIRDITAEYVRGVYRAAVRDRALTPDEIRQFLRAMQTSNIRREFKIAFQLILMTPVRKSGADAGAVEGRASERRRMAHPGRELQDRQAAHRLPVRNLQESRKIRHPSAP